MQSNIFILGSSLRHISFLIYSKKMSTLNLKMNQILKKKIAVLIGVAFFHQKSKRSRNQNSLFLN